MFEKPLVLIDFETSGMSPEQGGRVTEVAALRIVGSEVTERFVSLINCNVRISSFITDLTGITQAMVNRAPAVSTVMPQLLDFIGKDTLVAHNASFDEKFLLSESNRLGLTPEHQGLICSVKLARRVLPGMSSYSLGRLAAALGIRFQGNAHRAEADAQVTAELMLKIAKNLQTTHGLKSIDPALLIKINRLSAAKVADFLRQINTAEDPEEPKKLKKSAKIIKGVQQVSAVMHTESIRSEPQFYRHYKGGLYELLHEATQESDLTPVIVYRAENGTVWTRAKSVFFEEIEVGGKMLPRFKRIT